MYFNVYGDSGAEIRGYLVPDGFSAEPEVLVRIGGEIAAQVKCDCYIDTAYLLGHHETGLVGFKLNEQNVPGFFAGQDIEIADAETGLVIYRRLEPGRYIEKRVFRLETHIEPWAELDRFLAPHFQFHTGAIERFGSETVQQSLEIINQPSTYVSGRILVRRFQPYMAKETLAIAVLADPFVELATRISVLSRCSKVPVGFLTERDRIFFRPAIEYLADVDLQLERSVRAKMKMAPPDVLKLFASPFTHQLSATSPGDVIGRDSLSIALDTLSQFAFLGIDGETSEFAADISELLGISVDAVAPPDTRQRHLELSCILRSISSMEHLLESDLILCHLLKNASKISKT